MNDSTILIVEDSAAQRAVLRQFCQNAGFQHISEAENGRAALAAIDASGQAADILICDLEMPEIDGIELINLLSARQISSALIIVSGRERSLLSAVELMASTEGLYVLGSLQKPVQESCFRQLLYQSCQSWLSSKRGGVKQTELQLTKEQLQQALNDRRFVLHYQPKIDFASAKLIGAEALVRLQTAEDDQLIFPNDFIPLCERFGLIDELSYQVIELAIAQQQRWVAAGLDLTLSINLSAYSFEQPEFSARVIALIKDCAVPPNSLIFEVTETGVIKDIGRALAILTRLRLFGCGLSIDDYGTGYSSVKQLSQIPFTELKVDRSLIHGICGKPHLQVIFESTLSMCQKLGIELVAEGVERPDDWRYLLQAGCNTAQGYLISPPLPEQRFSQWVAAGMTFLSQVGEKGQS
ncbi:EAL domain-containing response regulator [Rheinheimera texasensis]|uniref:EAL domain-containing response regulator n=1 Tax=Rheinheimera texasensis TaxID=306205 RepID=UPI00068ED04F|nr:EAL domain-containing response regulator [Rheinheimera texasensis]